MSIDTRKIHQRAPQRTADRALTVPVSAERIVVRKRRVTTGTVRLRKTVRERIVNVDEPLVHQNVVIERRPVGRIVDAVAAPRREGDTLVIPVMEEVLVTRLRVIEEIRIHVRRSVGRQRRAIRLRREDVEIERRAGSPSHNGKRS